jgi:hypothetical protein
VRLPYRILGSLTLVGILASCTSSGTALRPTTTTVQRLGTVCGYLVSGGGLTQGPVPPPAVARQCVPASVPVSFTPANAGAVTITAASGKSYVVDVTKVPGRGPFGLPVGGGYWVMWSARLPAGTYHVVGWACAPSEGKAFVLAAGETLRSVRVYRNCDIA